MELVFTCPAQHLVFTSQGYRITDNNGVTTDAAGNKVLDAKVALNHPCPHCGGMHVYHVSELACPFGT